MQNPTARAGNDMTEGSIFSCLFRFMLPLLIGNMFQELYNLVDTWVVGNYVSTEAFSAVGTVTPIINTLIGAFNGFSNGAGVVISQYYGARNDEQVSYAIHTSMAIMLPGGVLFALIGVAMTPRMLHLMKTPAEVFPEASAYLTIYFSGIISLMIYNMGAGILRSVGDSKRPFVFLLIGTALNIILDLLFVIRLGLGVQGVAYATVIAQTVSAVLVILSLARSSGAIRLHWRQLHSKSDVLKEIAIVGFPAAMQMAVTAFSNTIVQSYINAFGTDCMSGWTAYSKVDQLLFLPMKSLSMTTTTFVAQNLGCGRHERARKGVRISFAMTVGVTLIISGIVIFAAPEVVSAFNDKKEAVEYGTLFLRRLTPFFVFCCANQIYSGALRGTGNSRMPMLIMLFSFVVFRQVYLFVMANCIMNEIIPIALCYPAGWIVCSILTLGYYTKHPITESIFLRKHS